MEWLLLQLLGLLTVWLVYPNYDWLQPIQDYIEWQQIVYQDELERNHQAEQKDIIINDYFLFLDKIWKIRYARGCAGGYEGAGCSSKSFDCGGAMKAYLSIKWLIEEKEVGYFNSRTLYELGTPKDPRTAERWDFMYRRWFGEVESGNLSTHFAVVSKEYDGKSIRIYDNVVPGGQDKYQERKLRLTCNATFCYYANKYRVRIATNGWYELASTKWIDVLPRADADKNPLNFSVTISWYSYDSVANRIASYWYDNLPGDAEDLITTMYGESALNPETVAKNGDSWVCQRSPIRHSEFINSTGFDNYMVQAKACLEKRVALKYDYKRANYWKAYDHRYLYKDKIIYHLTKENEKN